MKKLLMIMAITAMAAGCGEQRPAPLEIDTALTAAEIEAGVFTPEVMWKMGRAGSSSVSPDGRLLLYTVTYYNVGENRGVTAIYTEDIDSHEVRQLTDFTSNNSSPAWSADGKKIYFLSDRSGKSHVWSMSADGSAAAEITTGDSMPDVEGFGVSADGSHIWWVETVHAADRRSADVHKDMPRSNARIYDDLMARHWDYWDEGDYRHIFVGTLDGNSIAEGRDIMEGAPWDAPLAPYFDMAEIAWSPDGSMLAYTCKPLTGTEYAESTDSDIFIYWVEGGKTLNICKPVSPDGTTEYPHKGLPFVGYDKYPVWSPDGSKIAFRSMERAAHESDKERLFVYDCRTGDMQYVTENFDYNAMNVVWEDDETLLFIAPIAATHQICRAVLPVSGPAVMIEIVTSGDHDITAFTSVGGRTVAELCTISSATEFYDVDMAGGALTRISDINTDIYDNIRMGEVQKRWVTTTDGKKMLTWVILPPDFDPAKKYPTLLYCQGGPQSVVSNGWSYRWNYQLMAARGYIVVAPNRRGLPSFGQEWLDQISGDYSGQNIRDYLSAIDDVTLNEPWADRNRMGCVGASYGGYSVFYLAGHHDKRFKAFIAHCGIFNFESMYGETEELFFINTDYGGNYWDKSNAVAQRSYANSPHKAVDKWDTPILIFTGERDFRIPYTQSLEAFTAARVRGIPARLVEFENEAHQVFKPQNSLVWNREFFGWLDKHVKGE